MASFSDLAVVSSILGVLRERTGLDFSRYRPATVQRRIANRMISVGAVTPESYLALLQSSETEALQLLNRVSIKVSRFYRNRAAWDLLRRELLPQLAAGAAARPLRIWSVGCGCGEEPYTLAMLLDEAGVAATVHATDIDPAALEAAERGLYAPEAAAELPPELASRYLVPAAGGRRGALAAAPALKDYVRFSRLDLLSGRLPGPPGYDLICCRNVLIYLQPDVRQGVFQTLHRALKPGGLLFLGEAEWPPEDVADTLESLGRSRIFRLREAIAA